MKYIGETDYDHKGLSPRSGVLLCNLGTPDKPSSSKLRSYLKQFLSDPRVVEVPRIIWWLVLNLIILTIRPRRSAKLYQTVWTEDGSPLLVNSLSQTEKLKIALEKKYNYEIPVELGMRYGNPSIHSAIEKLTSQNVRNITVLPLYPQYSGATTGSTFDAIAIIIGVKRAVFSNEAGIGSAAIAHSAAKVSNPVEEGAVALLEPFIDTIIVCSMTALVIIITGAHTDPSNSQYILNNQGGALTSSAMGSVISWFPNVLSVAVFLFAFSTMISWSYYGERCWVYLFGDKSSIIYKILFLLFTFLGSIITATNILDFSDLMILGMAFPNILGLVLLSGNVKQYLHDYEKSLKSN